MLSLLDWETGGCINCHLSLDCLQLTNTCCCFKPTYIDLACLNNTRQIYIFTDLIIDITTLNPRKKLKAKANVHIFKQI